MSEYLNIQAKKLLIFFATYNEVSNIRQLLSEIWSACPTAEVLVVDDNSPDGTGVLLKNILKTETRLKVFSRPRKLGLGSAHFIAMMYAIDHDYDYLVTMDADLSHNPSGIPRILLGLESVDFIIGSRYMLGGSCDYSGYRKQLSVVANFAARLLTGIPIHEFTNSFRGFKVNALSKVKFNWIGNLGYSFFLESVVRLNKAGLSISEIPIHFYNRHRGDSKIPSFEIFRGAYKLFYLFTLKYFSTSTKSIAASSLIYDICPNCEGGYLFETSPESLGLKNAQIDSNVYKCSSMSFKDKPQLAKCFQCGLVQIPFAKHPKDLESLYKNVTDFEYIVNLKVKEKTFSSAFKQLRPFLPVCGTLLEIGSYCGLFLKEAKKFGWECVGIEPSKWAAAYSVENDPSLTIVNSSFSKAIDGLEGTSFDVIVSWDVLEHVPNPSIFIRDVGSLLRPGGIFAFSTLDIDSWFPKLMQRRWPWIMAMHLYYFTPVVLRDMLNRRGMELIHIAGYRHYASLRYLFIKFTHTLPNFLYAFLSKIAPLIPEVIIPVTLGDVKLFIARKI